MDEARKAVEQSLRVYERAVRARDEYLWMLGAEGRSEVEQLFARARAKREERKARAAAAEWELNLIKH